METGAPNSLSAPIEPSIAGTSSPPQAGEAETAQFIAPPVIPSEKPRRYEIFNKTPRRIAIASTVTDETGQPQYLVISPFSTKVLSEDTIHNYEYQRWEQEDLVEVKELVTPTDDNLTALGYGVGCGFMLVIYLVVALLVPFFRLSLTTWIIFAVLSVAALVMIAANSGAAKDIPGAFKRVGQGILQLLNLALFLTVVLGLGVGLFYLFSGGRELIASGDFTMEGLARLIQYLFLTIATLLPALMYFLFDRRQREKVQETFIREVLRLDPGIRTITEAESKYLSLVQETFGTTHSSAFLFSSGLPILLSTLLIFMGWLMVLQPFTASGPIDIQQLENLLLPRANAVTFAFLGAYFFGISLVFRRYVRADLTPKTYTHIILRLLLAIILAWTLSALPVFTQTGAVPDTDDSSTGLIYLLAFFIGIFPETGVTVLRDLARNPLFTRLFPPLEEQHPLTRLDGINLYDRSRFLEEGIENIENLAHHNLISLMLSTRISTNRLIDMFDQAILYLHLGLDPDEVHQTRQKLRQYGIRTATDLEAAHQSAEERGSDEFQKFLMILDDASLQPASLSRLQTTLDTLRDDDWMSYLRNWRELHRRSTQTFTLKGISLVPLEEQVQAAMARAI